MLRLPRKTKFWFSLIVVIVAVLYQQFVGLPLQQEQPTVQGVTTDKQSVQVAKVIDGDTITVLLDGKKVKVRVIGLNTPESVDPRRAVQCFGKEASQFAKTTLQGKTVRLEADPTQDDHDKYGRLLRYVWFQNGGSLTDFGKFMLANGYGHEYTYDVPYKYQSEYSATEKQAREAGKGLWADSACAEESGK